MITCVPAKFIIVVIVVIVVIVLTLTIITPTAYIRCTDHTLLS